jgi:hypothetical protein
MGSPDTLFILSSGLPTLRDRGGSGHLAGYAAGYENFVLVAHNRRRARRAREGAARGVGAPASDRAGVRGGAPV